MHQNLGLLLRQVDYGKKSFSLGPRRHDNKDAVAILNPNVIQSRNRVNAISIAGLFAGWLMEAWYLLLTGVLVLVLNDQDWVREVSAFLKVFEFVLVPFLQGPILDNFFDLPADVIGMQCDQMME